MGIVEELYRALKGEESRLAKYAYLFDLSKLDLSSIASFKESLEAYLNEKFKIEEVLQELSSKCFPINSVILADVLGIKQNEASLILRILKDLQIIVEIRIFRVAKTTEERIFLEVLNKGVVRFSQLLSKYENAREAVISLWKKGKIRIIELEREGITPSKIDDLDKIELDEIEIDRKFVEIWYDEFTGKEYGRLIIPINARIVVNVREIIGSD